MKYFFTLWLACLFTTNTAWAQKNLTDTTATPSIIKELNLTNEQLVAIKTLIAEYKREERNKRLDLRNSIFFLLNTRQQMMIRRLWSGRLANAFFTK